jgi:hypothetical protein
LTFCFAAKRAISLRVQINSNLLGEEKKERSSIILMAETCLIKKEWRVTVTGSYSNRTRTLSTRIRVKDKYSFKSSSSEKEEVGFHIVRLIDRSFKLLIY